MIKLNILKNMYNLSPMNFYTYESKDTIIKSINNTSCGYRFDRQFSSAEIDIIWNEIKLHKRFSTIFIFLLFVSILYVIIFPNYALLVNNNWYLNLLIILSIILIICQFTTIICTKIFELRLKSKFGQFLKCKFLPAQNIDKKYYNIFKFELIKVMILILLICITFVFASPFEYCKTLLKKNKYDSVIRITTIGAKIFPIAQEWYSLRGFANYNKGNFQNAINDFDIAYKLGADGFNIMNFDNKIFIKYYIKDYNGALSDFDNEIMNADNENEKDQFLWDKAQFLYNIKEYKQALILYNELIEKSENDRIYLLKDRLYLERAQVYKQLGEDNLANSDIENSGIQDNEVDLNPIPTPVIMIDD